MSRKAYSPLSLVLFRSRAKDPPSGVTEPGVQKIEAIKKRIFLKERSEFESERDANLLESPFEEITYNRLGR